MQTTLSPKRVNAVLEHVVETAPSSRAGDARPVHVVYGGAHLFTAETHAKLGKIALASMETHAKDARAFAALVGLADATRADDLVTRVKKKLEREPVEAYCIDFEDGYGPRPDEEEDADAVRTAAELAKMRDEERTLSEASDEAGRAPVVGIRVKAVGRRAARTLDLFVTTLAKARSGKLPSGFSVTLPKVRTAAEVSALALLLDMLEEALGTARGGIRVELMVETHEALESGALAAMVAAARGRCSAAHLGAYDLTASVGVTASDQRMDNPICDAARVAMQIALAKSGVAVVDGATTVLPVGKDTSAVHDAWRLHASNVRRALAFGIGAGWDLHPAQLPARYGALYAYFLGERDAMAQRLAGFIAKSKQATRAGQVFDDAATGRGLAAFFLRGLACGALFDDDLAGVGLTRAELASLGG
ncbi:MAG TPA: aldolase/citrate lyase family protein [Labilithrix sp.]|jgi:citrate lyase beta subunit